MDPRSFQVYSGASARGARHRQDTKRYRVVDPAQFLQRLHQGGKWAYLWTSEGSRSAWYPVGRPLPTLGSRAREIYFGVHPTGAIPAANSRGEPATPGGVRSQKAHIAAVNCLFSEFDAHGPGEDKRVALLRIIQLRPPPSVIIDSGGGYHCYWLLSETFMIRTDEDRERIDSLQKGWVAYTGGDDGSKDLARMLRLPGTQNHKYMPPRPVQWVKYRLELVYSLSELEQRAQATIPKKRAAQQASSGTERQPSLHDAAQAAASLDRLAAWRCDEYRPWIEVGMSLSQLGKVGLALWDLWSQRSDKYKPGVCEQKWRTFTPGEGLTLGSLHYWANEDNALPEHRRVSAGRSASSFRQQESPAYREN